ncbi:MAG: hypothetical protein ACRBCI_02540 [Cellvibrionaceae bacterium]
MFRYCVFIVIWMCSSQLFALDANEWTLDINTGSKHSSETYGKNKYYNEENNGFGMTFGYSDMIDIKIGFFDNSYNKSSVYGGAVFNKDYYIFNDIVVSPGVGLMFTTGYHDTPIDAPALAPIVYPTITIGHKTLRSTIGYVPYGEDTVFTFQTQIQF